MEVVKIELDEKLDQRSLNALFAILNDAVGRPVEIGTSQVRHVGGQAAQILIAAIRKWSADGICFTVERSERFTSIVEGLGLEQEIFMKEVEV